MKRTKIVCTLGPATDNEDTLEQLIRHGMNVARLNFSHGSHEEHKKRIIMLKRLVAECSVPVAVMLDNKGPEIRIRQFHNPPVTLLEGKTFVLSCGDDFPGDETRVAVTYERFSEEVAPGSAILIDDGLIKLRVEKIDGSDIVTRIENGGELSGNKSINIPDVQIRLPALTKQDIEDIRFGIENDVDFIAASFIRTAQDVIEIRKVLEENGGEQIRVVSKIENRQGIDNIGEIIRFSDGIMVARGDLGVEIPPEEVPLVQKRIIRACNEAGKPVITATQMLDSMIRNPRPTRAEVGDVANAVFEGSDAVMLSGETAAGKYPVESLKTMVRVVLAAEEPLLGKDAAQRAFTGEENVTNLIAYHSCSLAKSLGAKAILTPTSSGNTARMAAKFRPVCPILAVTDKAALQRQLALSWGVEAFLLENCNDYEKMLGDGLAAALRRGILREGDLAVVTAGIPMNQKGTTNSIRVETVVRFMRKGRGIGSNKAKGPLNLQSYFEKIQRGDIVFADILGEGLLEQMHLAGGLITPNTEISNMCVAYAVQNNIPVLLGVSSMDTFPEGSIVEIDPVRNLVYRISK